MVAVQKKNLKAMKMLKFLPVMKKMQSWDQIYQLPIIHQSFLVAMVRWYSNKRKGQSTYAL